MIDENIIKEVEERVKKEIARKYEPNMLGYIHIFETRKKEILKEEYGIDFKVTREKTLGASID